MGEFHRVREEMGNMMNELKGAKCGHISELKQQLDEMRSKISEGDQQIKSLKDQFLDQANGHAAKMRQ